MPNVTPIAPAGMRIFVSAIHANTDFMVVHGDDNDPGNLPMVTRDDVTYRPTRVGDVWAKFNDGFLATDDPRVIAFCESRHPSILDYERADTEMLVTIQRLTTPRDDYETEEIPGGMMDMSSRLVEGAINKAIEQANARHAEELAAAIEQAREEGRLEAESANPPSVDTVPTVIDTSKAGK